MKIKFNKVSGLRLNDSQIKAVSKKMIQAREYKSYPYPWQSLERDLKRQSDKLFLVVYGSLLSTKSASKTIHDRDSKRLYPVLAFGFKRVFNYEMPLDGGRYGPPKSARARAALNVKPTAMLENVVNGLLLEISPRDIHPTRMRELGYDLVPVVCVKWNDAESLPFVAYILSCPNKVREGRMRTNSQIEPHRKYYLVCRNGAADFGDEFLQLWLSTTFLADGITPVRIWEKTVYASL